MCKVSTAAPVKRYRNSGGTQKPSIRMQKIYKKKIMSNANYVYVHFSCFESHSHIQYDRMIRAQSWMPPFTEDRSRRIVSGKATK
jgi:hypothetical protein